MNSAPKHVLIVDDEPAARAQLRDVIDAMPGLEVVGECSDGNSAIEDINRAAPDVVFLDIDMPGVDGFGVAQATQHLKYQLVFLTAHHQHALRAFETHAIDYLLKPARPSLIEKCLAKILRQEVMTLEGSAGESRPSALVLSESSISRVIDTEHVLYIEGLGRYRRLHLTEAGARVHKLDTLLSDTTLEGFAQELEDTAFIRVHRSYLVNLSQVISLKSTDRRYELFMQGSDVAIPVSRSRVKDLKISLGMDRQ